MVAEVEVAIERRRVLLGLHQATGGRLANVYCQSSPLSVYRQSTLTSGFFTQCLDSRQIQLASFVPPPIDASPPLPDATLTVFPDGHEYFEHILISALVVERKLTLSF